MSVVLRPLRPLIVNEIPSGSINGSNVIFTTTNQFTSGTTQVYLNGQRLKLGASFDYTETTSTSITLNLAPIPGDVVLVDYWRVN